MAVGIRWRESGNVGGMGSVSFSFHHPPSSSPPSPRESEIFPMQPPHKKSFSPLPSSFASPAWEIRKEEEGACLQECMSSDRLSRPR